MLSNAWNGYPTDVPESVSDVAIHLLCHIAAWLMTVRYKANLLPGKSFQNGRLLDHYMPKQILNSYLF
jgi:hypothetical protein